MVCPHKSQLTHAFSYVGNFQIVNGPVGPEQVHNKAATVQIELSAVRSPRAKLVRFLRISRIFAAELIGTLTIAPYGAHTAFVLQDSIMLQK